MKNKIVIVNMNIQIQCPRTIKTDEQAEEYAKNYELPKKYVDGSFEIVKILDEE